MINLDQLRNFIIRPILKEVDLWSKSAENLLIGTCLQESLGGTYLRQIKGPALGIFQMERDTYNDIYVNYLIYRDSLCEKILCACQTDQLPTAQTMIHNLFYATCLARVNYLRVPKALPDEEDLNGMANYWKLYYNTPNGRGTEKEYIDKYNKYVINT